MRTLAHVIAVFSLYVSSCTPTTIPTTLRVQPPATLPEYAVCRTKTGIRIDGTVNESDWNKAHPVQFIFPWNDVEKESRQGTISRLLWDDEYLYILYQCDDPFLHATVTTRDGPIYEEDAVEFFATPNAKDISAYVGFEMNVLGTLFDYIAFGGGTAWTPNIHPRWQSEGVEIASTYRGTLNAHEDIDGGWILEIAIPLGNFRHLGGRIPPHHGDQWRAALNRTAGFKG